MIACFDFLHRIPTYDYFTWLTHVKLLGATEVCFTGLDGKYRMRKKWPYQETEKRIKNYILPGVALADLPYKIGNEGDRHVGSHMYSVLWEDAQRLGKEIPRLRSVDPPAQVDYTVTMRRAWFKPERNCDEVLWTLFARRIGARIIHEFDQQPISLYERVSLYAGAKMNFGVPNGPLAMLLITSYPVTIVCDPEKTAADWSNQGVLPGQQMPWSLPNQKLVWEKPTMECLLREFERCQESRSSASTSTE